jgi:hypothetical protein
MGLNMDELLNNKHLAAPTAPPTQHNIVNKDHRLKNYMEAVITNEIKRLTGAPEGQRNHQFNASTYAMMRLVHYGFFNTDDIAGMLKPIAQKKGLTPTEIHKTFESAKSGLLNPKYVDVPEGLTQEELLEYIRTAQETPPPIDHNNFWGRRETLKIIHQGAQHLRTSPLAVLGVTLARMCTMIPPHYVLPPITGGPASLNIFIGLVGPSGSGKGAATAASIEIFNIGDDLDGSEHIKRTMLNLGSGEGVVHAFRRNPTSEERQQGINTPQINNEACLFMIPEIDLLTATAGRQGATIMPILRSMWSGEQLGFQNADQSKRLQVTAHTYRACIVAGIQPLKADKLLGDSDGGTPQRFLFLPVDDPTAPPRGQAPPQVKPIQWFLSQRAIVDGKVMIQLPQQIIDEIEDRRLMMLTNQKEAASQMGGHDMLGKLKIAALLALLENRIIVDLEDWELAGVIHRYSVWMRESMIKQLNDRTMRLDEARIERESKKQDHLARTIESEKEAILNAVTHVLAERQKAGKTASVTRNMIAQQIHSKLRPKLDKYLTELVDAGRLLKDCGRYEVVNDDQN